VLNKPEEGAGPSPKSEAAELANALTPGLPAIAEGNSAPKGLVAGGVPPGKLGGGAAGGG
jgi:hypothetical protein